MTKSLQDSTMSTTLMWALLALAIVIGGVMAYRYFYPSKTSGSAYYSAATGVTLPSYKFY